MFPKFRLLLLVPLVCLSLLAIGCDSGCDEGQCCPCVVAPDQSEPAPVVGDILTEREHFATPPGSEALNEVKTGNWCPTCPNRIQPSTVYRPGPVIDQVAKPQPAKVKRDPLVEKKTGTYLCICCRNAKVGTLFKTSWTDSGIPVTYLCLDCWESSTVEKRIASFEQWSATQTIKPKLAASMRSAVVSEN